MYIIDETYKIDKSTFGDGPWQDEPDKITWKDPETDLDCMIVRQKFGILCGYVGVPLDSKLIGIDYNNIDVNVHGGLTYSGLCQGHICHKSDEEVFWFGFDCGHIDDYSPGMSSYFKDICDDICKPWPKIGIYRDIEYVKSEVTSLAKQIKELHEAKPNS